jgi:hypothetical protein
VISRELFILWAYFQPIEIKFFLVGGADENYVFFWLFQKSTKVIVTMEPHSFNVVHRPSA